MLRGTARVPPSLAAVQWARTQLLSSAACGPHQWVQSPWSCGHGLCLQGRGAGLRPAPCSPHSRCSAWDQLSGYWGATDRRVLWAGSSRARALRHVLNDQR